jgi:putative Ca2+/H+ antiporter (TMEM165/GDT1 family)
VPAVLLGNRVLKVVPLSVVRYTAAGLFLILGLWVLAQTAGWLNV